MHSAAAVDDETEELTVGVGALVKESTASGGGEVHVAVVLTVKKHTVSGGRQLVWELVASGF